MTRNLHEAPVALFVALGPFETWKIESGGPPGGTRKGRKKLLTLLKNFPFTIVALKMVVVRRAGLVCLRCSRA